MEFITENIIKTVIAAVIALIATSSLSACGAQIGGLVVGTSSGLEKLNHRAIRTLEIEAGSNKHGSYKNRTK